MGAGAGKGGLRLGRVGAGGSESMGHVGNAVLTKDAIEERMKASGINVSEALSL